MRVYYHATSYKNALLIIQNGFKRSKTGMLGNGIYFAEKPEGALKKAHCPTLDCILIVILNVGRVKTATSAHRNYDLKIINNMGYDSIEMRHCKTGPEICVFEPHRIKIICIAHWTNTDIEFNEITGLNVDLADFLFLINNRKVTVKKSKLPINGSFPQNLQFTNNGSFNGILNYIRNANVNLIDINVSSIYPSDKNNWPQNIINYSNDDSSFCTNDQTNQWICFDFKNHTVIPNYYTIRSFNKQSNVSHLKSWVIEGSNNNASWTILDCETNCSYLNGPKYCHSFPIFNPNCDAYRFIRLRQTDLNWRNRNYLKINCIEFFGKII